jgi:PhnB protein
MLVTHIYFDGQCKEAIDLYIRAFGGSIETIIPKSDQDDLIVHAEILIHNQLLMLNDFGNNAGFAKSGGYQLCVKFDTVDDLNKAYSILEEGSTVISAMQETDYSVCVIRFIDKFDVRWGFWV